MAYKRANSYTYTHITMMFTTIGPIATLYTLCTVTTPSLYTSRIMWESVWPWGEREKEGKRRKEREGGLGGRGGEKEKEREREGKRIREKQRKRCCVKEMEGQN